MSRVFNAPSAVDLNAEAFGPQWQERLVWQLLLLDGELAHYRISHADTSQQWRAVRPASNASGSAARRLEHEFSLADQLMPQWALQPLALLPASEGPWLVLEDFGAQALHEPAEAALPVDRFLQLAIGAADALAGAHAHGLLHRDVKPCNLLEDADGVVRLGGFGLSVDVRAATVLPVADSICGTLAYMSPEQSRRVERHADQRSDLYSLGMTFYEWLAGRLPFEARDAVEWVYCHVARQPPALTHLRGDIPPALSQLVLKLIAKNPDDRYQSALSVRADLGECLRQWRQFRDIADFRPGQCEARQPPSLSYPSTTALPLEAGLASRTSVTILGGRDTLDLSSVMKAAQAMRDESQQDRLIELLMRNTIIHAGAQRALLLLVKNKAPMICAIGQGGGNRRRQARFGFQQLRGRGGAGHKRCQRQKPEAHGAGPA